MTQQLQLVPDERAEGAQQRVRLKDLPRDSQLVGPEPDAAFVASVRRFGVLQNVLLIEARDNGTTYGKPSYKVAAGRRRIKAARLAGLETIPAIIYTPDWTASDVLTLVENQQRTENPASDLRAIKGLMEKGANEEEICAATGLLKGTLKKRLKLVNLHDELLSAYEDGLLKTSTAEAAAKLSKERQKPLVSLLLEQGKLKYKDVAAMTRVGAQESVAALPDMLFSTPELKSAPSQPTEPEEYDEEYDQYLRYSDRITELARRRMQTIEEMLSELELQAKEKELLDVHVPAGGYAWE